MLKSIAKVKDAYPNSVFKKEEALILAKRLLVAELEIAEEDIEIKTIEYALEKISIERFDFDKDAVWLQDDIASIFDDIHCISVDDIENVIDSLLATAEGEFGI